MNKWRVARRSDYIGSAALLCLWGGCAMAPVVAVWQLHTLPWLVGVAVTQAIFGLLTWTIGSQVGPQISQSFFSFMRGGRQWRQRSQQ